MRRIRWPAIVVVGVLVAGGGTAYAVTGGTSSGNYRTVAATTGDVEQVLQASGTVDAAHRADLEFATSGTVARVRVALGEAVSAGQVVATLDTEALDAAVTRARAGLARAIAQLDADEDSQAQAVSDAAASSAVTTPHGDVPSSPTGGADTSQVLAHLKEQQDAVTDAQAAASAAIAAAKDALAAQTAACADAYDAPATDDEATDDGATDPDTADGSACTTALATVQQRQDDVAAAQDALATALSALTETLSKTLGSLTAPTARTTARTTADVPSSSADQTADGSSGATRGTVTAAQLASDQAAIEQARAELVGARQQRRQAVLRSTRSGRVVALDVARGDDVSAGDVVATVIGGTTVTITTTVPESRIGQVQVGQQVRVTTPGETAVADGTVTAIGLVADSSSGTASYPVTVTVEDPAIALPPGSEAMLAIVTATAHDVVTVPTSAVTRSGDGADGFVRTWDGTSVSRTAVTIGTVGARTVGITKGLSAGERVVLADVDQEITGAADQINDRGFNRVPIIRMNKSGGGPVTFSSGG